MKYRGSAHGRLSGAIGICHTITIEFEAESDKAADEIVREEFYRQGFEHVSNPVSRRSE